MKLPLFLFALAVASPPGAGPALAKTAVPFHSLTPASVDSNLDPNALRRHYEQAAADKAAGEKFYKLLANYNQGNALVLGYKGAAEAIRARDASMFNKMDYIKDAARTFEQAVAADPRNAEVRFLRFSVESNLPGFLGLSKHLDEDKEVVLQALLKHPGSGLEPGVFQMIRHFMVSRNHVSEAEAGRLNKLAQ
ncbi:hypothetical protein GCM10023185_42320 [Hymenobacter saemangeumensis]|uniref:Tetratricopeptide repeat protein n=1 Tax=Hymenobacter saemangeumensis TaxID=1084522 RepID=A0ABP8IRM8_9BACT